MYRNKKISFYYPCRNEAGHLEAELRRVPSFVDEVFVVSNKSTDNTISLVNKLGYKIVVDDRCKKGIGYGYAHMSGINLATGDIIATADADGTYPVAELNSILDYLIDNQMDFVSCNRYPIQERDSVGWILQAGVKFLNLETNVLFGIKIKDVLSGMWVFNSRIKNKLRVTEGDWNLSPQIKINAATNKEIKFGEYHININPRKGRTKQKYLKTGISHMIWIFKNRVKPKTIKNSAIFSEKDFSFIDRILHKWRSTVVNSVDIHGKRVCDLGCGIDGNFLRKLERYILSGTGIDLEIDDKFNSKKIKLIASDLNNLIPLENASIDVVFSLAVLEHLNEPITYIKESYRILSDNGKIVLTTPSPFAKPVLELLSYMRLINRESIRDHKHYFSKNELIDLFQSCGFKKINFKYFQLIFNQRVIAVK